mmetsp:Transcript_38886/g.77160  ORF Transcript_38886/g.77160 Transcript_38886/m.77160 type:complete len:94 (-) Transcript_38886:104-385(-)
MALQAASVPWDHHFVLGCSWETSSTFNLIEGTVADNSFWSVPLLATACSPPREAIEPCKLWEPQKVTAAHCGAGMKVKKLPQGEPVKKMPLAS